MKKSITVIALLGGAVGLHAQGSVSFNTYQASWNIAVYSPQADGSAQFGNTSTDIPAGNTVYTGVPLGGAGASAGTTATSWGNGSDYTIGLYAVPGASGDISLQGTTDLISTATFATTGGTGQANVINGPAAGLAGSWNGNNSLQIPNTSAGGAATIQLAAWYNGGGTITSYSAAISAGMPFGSSIVAEDISLGGQPASGPPITPGDLAPITSFSLQSVPEPSTIALGAIGASALLMRLRRKQ
jgi:hypothetical protein